MGFWWIVFMSVWIFKGKPSDDAENPEQLIADINIPEEELLYVGDGCISMPGRPLDTQTKHCIIKLLKDLESCGCQWNRNSDASCLGINWEVTNPLQQSKWLWIFM